MLSRLTYGGKGQACELDCFRDNFDFLLLEDFYGNTKVVIHLNSSQATLKKLSSKELECKRIYKLFYHAILMNLAWIWSKLSKIANDDGYIKIPMSSKLEFAYLSKNKDKMEDTFKLHGDLAGFTFDHQFKQFKVDFLQGSRKPAFDAWPRILRITQSIDLTLNMDDLEKAINDRLGLPCEYDKIKPLEKKDLKGLTKMRKDLATQALDAKTFINRLTFTPHTKWQ